MVAIPVAIETIIDMKFVAKISLLFFAISFCSIASACPGDFDNDGFVRSSDLLMMLSKLNQEGEGIPEDLDQDGKVDISDVLSLLSLMGNQCD